MKIRLLILTLCLSSLTARASYNSIPLLKLICAADVIALGEITALDSSTFTFSIKKSLFDDLTEITVAQFTDWECAKRWTDYEIGQKILLFAVKLNDHSDIYRPLGSGNEGELPVFEDNVYINNLSLSSCPAYFPDSLRRYRADVHNELYVAYHSLYGDNFDGHKTDINDLFKTIRNVRECFALSSPSDWWQNVSVKCEDAEINAKRESDYILDTILSQRAAKRW
jgi:hypothetical protein